MKIDRTSCAAEGFAQAEVGIRRHIVGRIAPGAIDHLKKTKFRPIQRHPVGIFTRILLRRRLLARCVVRQGFALVCVMVPSLEDYTRWRDPRGVRWGDRPPASPPSTPQSRDHARAPEGSVRWYPRAGTRERDDRPRNLLAEQRGRERPSTRRVGSLGCARPVSPYGRVGLGPLPATTCSSRPRWIGARLTSGCGRIAGTGQRGALQRAARNERQRRNEGCAQGGRDRDGATPDRPAGADVLPGRLGMACGCESARGVRHVAMKIDRT